MNRFDAGMTLALMGLDGVGKSTQAEYLTDALNSRGHSVYKVHHASTKVPGVKGLKERYHRAAVKMVRGEQPGRTRRGIEKAVPSRGRVFAWMAALYLMLGSFLKSYWYCIRFRRSILIMDRCFLDDVVKVRWRLAVHTRLSTILLRLAPRPNVVIVMRGDPKETFDRKKAWTCTYDEYLEKSRALDFVLAEVKGLGWPIETITVDGCKPGEVLGKILGIMQSRGLAL